MGLLMSENNIWKTKIILHNKNISLYLFSKLFNECKN